MSEPLVVYGTDASYYTGKLEAYLRAKGIAYRLEPFDASNMRRCARHTGVLQVPQVECPDGTWLVDTTLILDHFETTRPEPEVHPRGAAPAFVSALLEDFADEWLWRPAMHYRWSFPENARLMSAWLAEHTAERRAPEWLKRRFWRRRQLGTFVRGDGVTAANRHAVEATYLATLAALEGIFAVRPYVLGERPSAADFGFFGSMFRHFACDPVPGRILRARAPGVHEWVARLWNGSPERVAHAARIERLPDDLGALFALVTGEYLPYLEANARAWAAGEARVRYEAGGARFEEPTKPYRVWCRDRLQVRLAGLTPGARAEVETAVAAPDALARLATPSPRPVASKIGDLPLPGAETPDAVDSWWRPLRRT
jgi:glutathione S-transferase